jgi:hypothetical protein
VMLLTFQHYAQLVGRAGEATPSGRMWCRTDLGSGDEVDGQEVGGDLTMS